MRAFKRIFFFFRNKYIVAIIAFVCWLAFFDRNDFYSQYRLRSELNKLLEQKQFFLNEIEHDSRKLKELESDPESLEKFAREKYLMKKENEDVFVIVKK